MPSEDIYEPTVSVIVPAINAETTIKALLDSLTEIDYDKRKIEIIVVDGGSKDRTRDIVRQYPVNLVLEEKRGLNLARNTGVKKSGGTIVLFTDSDCVVPKDWIRITVKNFEDPEVGCVGGSALRYEDTFLSRYADESFVPVLRRFNRREVLDNVELFWRYPAGCNMALRRSAIEKVNWFDEGVHYGFDEDELVERVCNAGYKLVLDPDSVIKHQHRTTLKHLLKQTFNYGRGGALLLRKKKAKDRISRWILTNLMLFTGWTVMTASLSFLSVNANSLFLLPLSLITVVPFSLLILSYVYKASEGKAHFTAIAYPFIDVIRLWAFCLGGVYGSLEPLKRKT